MKNIYRTGLEFFCVVLIAIFPAHCWPHSSSQSDNYSDWNTYVKEIEGPGKDEFKIIINETQEGLFKFSWKIQNLSQSNFEFSLNSRRQDRCKSNEFTESGIYNVEKGDILVWKFSYLGSGSNKVWLAFPESYAIKSSNKADRRDYFNASPDFSITNSNLDTRILPEFKSSDILVEPIWPKEGSILSANSQIPFKFIPLNLTTIPQCVLFIDDKSIYINNKSRNIELNRINIFETTITELGWHSWSISCYDCQGKFTNSRNTFFKIQNKNNTTYVNLDSSNPSNFSYSNIKDAMNNVSPHGTVYIENGLFYENLIIDKSIKLIGHNGSIDLFRKNKDIAAIEINSNDVEIKNLTLKNCTVAIQGGINGSEGDNYLQNITLYNNNIYNCTIGFEIYNTNNIKISNNNIECLTGKGRYIPDAIILKNCNNYSIDSNYINKNGTTKQLICCIYLENCGEPIINYNKFYNSKYAICYHNMKRLLNFTDLNFGFNKLDNLSVRIPICYEDSCE